MKYEIRLAGSDQDDGKIDLDRLVQLAQSITNIARGALQVKLVGVSNEKGRRSEKISTALKIKLSDLKKGSTILELECDSFKSTLEGQPGDLFKSEILEQLPDKTPMSLVIESFREAMNYDEDSTFLDKPLLKKLKDFKRVFVSDDELLTISNLGSIPEITLRKSDFKKIGVLEDSFPEPLEIVINGVVEELKYSKLRVGIATKQGLVKAVLSEELEPMDISKYWGQELTIAGRMHFLPSGKPSFIYIERAFKPDEFDSYFSKPVNKLNIEQQIQKKIKHQKHTNFLGDVVGQWPGDESIEDILKDLD
ncbi:MAG: hypothetical protein SGI83_03205 [Bacteroidota bacterium]|nr:hypothetical protein [Bacteroidota bacterium]